MIGFPKPPTAVVDRIAYKRERAVKEWAFRQAVWVHAQGRCERCERPVIRTIECLPNQGHVHHKRGRNVAPEDRYNPDAALLLCRLCHEGVHNGSFR